ncbi:hypothetical protein EJ05DRAFT_168399 [Pseudovirgaria hyperparasitica]|uniref:DUF6594 domain-containing protein n=1 Tax=Pseudovirgaria hyperparasitica TaxID=470096 RepID=A0A6A6VWQ4_9PEZI|nr:uncharacterized protein EJ05DRAFT_168399 [Pseudovirgaria hyperparasitica]KAF2753687.1 hypothetical protein EJ05DRAFT_168399 [Pseudovirgaria hyperparasitica]
MHDPSFNTSNYDVSGMASDVSSPPFDQVKQRQDPISHWKDQMGSYPSPPASIHLETADDKDVERDDHNLHPEISVKASSPGVPGTPLIASGAPEQPADDASDSSSDESSDNDDEGNGDGDDECREQGSEHNEAAKAPYEDQVQDSTGLEPFRYGSNNAAPGPSDVEHDHSARLRAQEEQIRHHMLHSPSPQPQHDSRFYAPGTMSPRPPVPFVSPFQYMEPPSRYGLSPVPLYHPQPNPPPVPVLPQYTQIHQPSPFPPPEVIDRSRETITGYELIAHRMTEKPKDANDDKKSIPPMYRKFEHLNHRILLHLQDEITELEEELRFLDESIAQMAPRGRDGSIQPASRRADARYGNDLHYRRTEILGKVYVKLGQYNQALSSFHSVKAIEGPKTDDINDFTSWLEQHTPVDKIETQFLTKKDDLLNINTTTTQATQLHHAPETASLSPAWDSIHPAMFVSPFAFLVPLFAIVFIPGTVARMIALAATALAIASLISLTRLHACMAHRDWAICGSIYFGLMSVLAALIR